jgi:hypothetical protein
VHSGWARTRGPLVACSAGLALAAGWGRPAPAGRDLSALARALGSAAGAAAVSPADIRWEPSRGAVADAVFGRWAVFLARAPGEDARDVWRARVRVTPEGQALDVAAAHDLTSTPLGDDHELVVRGTRAAFSTRAYGQEQSVTVLDLEGEGAQNKAIELPDRLMAALTSLQQTGRAAGVGRIGVTLESPARAVALELGEGSLAMTLYDGDGRRPPTASVVRLDLESAELAPPAAGLKAEPWTHLPKRFSHWVVDTLRAVPWIGPVPIAWLEDQALAARDAYRRLMFASSGEATNVAVAVAPPPPTLDTSQASVEEAHWPPPAIPTIWQSAEPGEGEWVPPGLPWLRAVPGVTPDAPSPFYRTFVRPDLERPYVKVLLVAMDLRQLDLDMEAGVEDPEPVTGPPGSGRIPRDPGVYRRVAAAYNGAFKTEHGHYGMMVHRRVLLPPVPGSATVIVLDDGRVGFGTWGADRRVGGVVGVGDDQIASFRQNLDPLLDQGRINPTGRSLWGFTLPGKGAQTERSGTCVTTSGHLVYAWGDDVSAPTLAKAMAMAACEYALHLDMNPYHTGFLFAAIDDLGGKKYRSQLLTPGMSIPVDRYIQYAPKDFFYVMVHDPAPAALDGGSPWVADGGTQPPPRWMPGVWRAHLDGPEGPVELTDVAPGRATWRIRAGAREAPASRPLRELVGDESRAVLLAATMGVASEKRPLGLATDGRLAVSMRGGAESGALVVGDDGQLGIVRADEAPAPGAHTDLAELPLVLFDGKAVVAAAAGPVQARAALGLGPDGRVLLARGTFASAAPLGEALARAGCVRAVALDRGTRAGALVDRSGTPRPPLARYDESVLYATGAPLRPRGFRFEPTTPYVPAPPPARSK